MRASAWLDCRAVGVRPSPSSRAGRGLTSAVSWNHRGADGRQPTADSTEERVMVDATVGHAVSEDDLVVGRFTIPGRELSWEFGTSGGPGGQHANKASTRAELNWTIDASAALPQDVKERVSRALSGRITQGVLTVGSDESRSQWRNRSIARKRMAELIADAARPPKTRRPTKPSRSAKRRRLEAKRKRSETKQLRGKVDPAD